MMDIAYRLFEKKNDYSASGSVGDMICPFDINGELTRLCCSDASGMTEFDNRIVVHSANPAGKIHELAFFYHPGQLDSVPDASRLGAGSPGSLLYAGKGIELVVYNTKTDYYVNLATRKSTAGFSAKANIEYRKWNFYGF